jgi:lipoprotein NlpI
MGVKRHLLQARRQHRLAQEMAGGSIAIHGEFMIFIKALSLLLLVAAGSAARAQTASDAAQCQSIANNPDLAIKHCTAAIESRKYTGEALAILHTSRGVEWSNKGEADRAISDFDASLKLKPSDAVVHHARAIEYSVKGDYARAIADFDTTIKINPKAEGVYFARGRTRFYMNEYALAANDIEAEFQVRPNIYTALWAYLARKRGGASDAEVLLERETRRLRAGWPSAVVVLYMGSTNAESVTIAASDPNPARQRELRCDADFFIAHWHLMKNENARAATLLRDVQNTCPRNSLEYEGAVAELRRLK